MSDRAIAKIIALVAAELDVPPGRINAASSIDTIPEWDSMAHLNICLAIQDSFGIKLDMEAIGESTSVASLAKLVGKAQA
jgi:acyl carrier protein